MFSYVSAEQRVPQAHPLRAIRRLADEVLRGDVSRGFDGLQAARVGRPSIPPERLLPAQWLQIFSIRSEHLSMEQLDYNLLFKVVRRYGRDEPIWAPTVFSEEPGPVVESDIRAQFLSAGSWSARRT